MRRKSLSLFVLGMLAIAGFAVALSATSRPFAQAARHTRPVRTTRTTTTTNTTTTTVPTTTTTPTGSAFPLRVSSNGRYLVDQNDVPFLMVGDSPQAAIGNLSES